MKKVLLGVCSVITVNCFAQNSIHGDNNAPLKLKDAAEAYMQELGITRPGVNDGKEPGRTMHKKEGKDYHFSRWYWHWDAHTDQNGYLVSPTKTLEEWRNYKQQHNNAANKTTAAVMADWKFQGPTTSFSGYSGIGRINNIAFHPTNSNTYWVSTAGGGLWKTTNNGINWVSLTDTLPVLGTSDLAVNPLNPNTLYLCTGDRDASDSYSIGVLKSTDGGISWNPTGLSWNTSQLRLTNAIVINKADTNSLTLATSNGIYKSYNGGTTWAQRVNGNFKQVLYHPTDTSILYATTYGTSAAQVYRSANGGANWTPIASLSGKRRITLAVTAADVKFVRAIAAANSGGLDGIYESTDTGKTFTKKYGPSGCNGDLISGSNSANPTSCGNQGWYDLAISISPTNPNLMTAGGVNSWYSTNGGTSWTRVTQWYGQFSGVATVHADKHWHMFHPLLPNRLFECNDGGLYFTDNLSSSSVWSDVSNGLGITQFYRNAVADVSPFVLAGAQDNGTKSLNGTFWDDENGGDGMDCQIDYTTSSTYYTSTQYGDIDRVSSIWGNDQISDNIPGNPTGPWITPFIISPHNHDHLFAGYKQVYFTPDAGDNWMSITGGDLESKDIERLAMTPANDSTIYVVINGTNGNGTNNVYVTHDFVPGNTATFNLITPTVSGNISDIKVDHKDKNHAWATFSGYGSPKVMEFNAGVWSNYNTNLPNFPVHCIEVDTSLGIMYVGTDVGVFYRDTITKQWEPFNKNLPSIEVTDLAINYTTKELWASTYGRGLWKSVIQDYHVTNDTTDTTDTTTFIAIIPGESKGMEISPNPNPGTFKVTTTIKDMADKTATISITDNTGRIAWESRNAFNSAGTMNVHTEGLPKGIYILRVFADDGVSLVGQKRLVIN